jgi:hypothetical protein
MNRELFGVLAAGHRAAVHRAHVVAAMATVHRRVIGFLRVVVIAVNWTLVATAAGSGNHHYGGARDLRVHERERNEAGPRA